MKKIQFEINGKSLTGYAQVINDTTWVHFGGKTFSVSNQSATQNRKGAGGKAGQKSANIISPMPGKITKILVRPGDLVEENQNVIVLEAMKMEYSLKAQLKGVVRDICFAVDALVPLGSILVVIEKAKDS